MSADSSLEATLERIQPVDPGWIEQARARQLQLTKPPGSLGRLEEIANRMAAIQTTLSPSVERPRIVLFAADHGVCAEGVNPYPQAVTAQMVANFCGAARRSTRWRARRGWSWRLSMLEWPTRFRKRAG